MNREVPDFSHIYLKSFDLLEYVRFVDKWFNYKSRYSIKLPINELISSNVKNILMLHNGLTETQFHHLTPSEFCTLMAKETTVNSKAQFYDTLKEAIAKTKPMIWKTILPCNHEYYYQGILTRQKIFKDMFSILMDNNSKYCPPVSGKSNGLAHLFLSMFDREYTTAVLRELPAITDANYSCIGDFLQAFCDLSKDWYDQSRIVKLIPYTHEFLTNTTESFKLQNKIYIHGYHPRKGVIPSTVPEDNKNAHVSYHEKKTRLHNVKLLSGVESDGEDIDSEENFTSVDSEMKSTDSDEESSGVNMQSEIDKEELKTLMLNAMQLSGNNPSANSAKGCWRYALFGQCALGDKCANAEGHTKAAVPNTRKWMLENLKSQIDKDNPDKCDPPRIMQRPK